MLKLSTFKKFVIGVKVGQINMLLHPLFTTLLFALPFLHLTLFLVTFSLFKMLLISFYSCKNCKIIIKRCKKFFFFNRTYVKILEFSKRITRPDLTRPTTGQ